MLGMQARDQLVYVQLPALARIERYDSSLQFSPQHPKLLNVLKRLT
jgi:hypothetical protein